MTNTKMTNKKALEIAMELIRGLDDENQYTEVLEKLDKMKVQVEKKSGGAKKPTATQVENETLKTIILEYLAEVEERKTVSELLKEIPELAELTNQRVTSLVTSLYKDGKLIREVDKRKAYFKVA